MSRLRILAILASLIALAAVLAACGSSSSKGNSEDPQKVVNEATLKGIKSANVDLSLVAKVEGKEGGTLNVSLSGPFQSEGKGQLPELDLSAKVNGTINGKSVNFEGGLTLLSEKAYVNYKGTEYEVEPSTFSYVRSLIERGSGSQQANSAGPTACEEAVSGLKVGSFVDNLTNDGSAEVAGTNTTHVSGDLNVPAAIEALLKTAKSPACSSQLSAAGPLPSTAQLEKSKGQVEAALKSAHIDLYVGSDHIVRKVSADLLIEPPSGSGGGPKKVNLTYSLSLSGVNQPQTINAPSGAKPLNELFGKLGINPAELLGATSGKGGLSGLAHLHALSGLSGAGGLGAMLKGLSGASTGGSSGPGSSAPGASSGAASGSSSQQAYLNCLKQGVSSASAMQKCESLLKK